MFFLPFQSDIDICSFAALKMAFITDKRATIFTDENLKKESVDGIITAVGKRDQRLIEKDGND